MRWTPSWPVCRPRKPGRRRGWLAAGGAGSAWPARRPPWLFDADSRRQLLQFFGVHDLDRVRAGGKRRARSPRPQPCSAGRVEETQKQRLPHLRQHRAGNQRRRGGDERGDRRHLELDSRVDGDLKATLLGVLGFDRLADGRACCGAGCIAAARPPHRRRTPPRGRQALIEQRADERSARAFRGSATWNGSCRGWLCAARPRDLSTPARRPVDAAVDPHDPRPAGLAAPAGLLRDELGEHDATARVLRAAVDRAAAAAGPRRRRHRRRLRRRAGRIARVSTNADQFLIDLERASARPPASPTRRLQPRAWLLHRDQQGPERQGAGALHPPPDPDRRGALHHRGTEGVRGQGCCRRASGRWRAKLLYDGVLDRSTRCWNRCAAARSR